MEKIIVLDLSDATVHVYSYDADENNVIDFLDSKGHKESECSWMICDNLNIHID